MHMETYDVSHVTYHLFSTDSVSFHVTYLLNKQDRELLLQKFICLISVFWILQTELVVL